MAAKTAITPTRDANYAEWYQQVIKHAEMAETSPVRGCMVIRPWGYALWEGMQRDLDARFKATGHENMYCPLLIPQSFLQREAEHVEGFATECAVVTHHRLVKNAEGQLEPASPLEEPLIIRPTSETMVGELFSRWVQSHRDLPLKMNQWANVMRWEMRTRLFLRTSEFLWQEGHTAHATEAEAIDEARSMAKLYADFCRERLAMPVIEGEKTEGERFPGALTTHTIEAMMQDGKALQAGTSHFLGQKFARAFDVRFQTKEGAQAHAWTTSWGVSTRLIGGLIMTHSDDDGLVLPPRIAPLHAVIIPLVRDEAQRDAVMEYCKALQASMQAVAYHGEAVRVRIDDRDERPGQKAWHWVKKGVPVRLEIGMREVEADKVFMGRRDQAYKEKKAVARDVFLSEWLTILDAMQQGLLVRAEQRMSDASVTLENRDDFYAYFKKKQTGFAYVYWCEDAVCEKKLKQDLAVTPRCLPNKSKDQLGPCIFSGKEGRLTLFAKAY